MRSRRSHLYNIHHRTQANKAQPVGPANHEGFQRLHFRRHVPRGTRPAPGRSKLDNRSGRSRRQAWNVQAKPVPGLVPQIVCPAKHRQWGHAPEMLKHKKL
eukprot:7391847-Prymnesium_polylepis.4